MATASTDPTPTPVATILGSTLPTAPTVTSTTSAVTSTTLAVGPRADELAVVWASGVIAIHDPDTGRLLRVVTTYDTAGESLHELMRGPDGSIYLSMAVEDSWYSCQTALGTLLSLSPEGEFATIGPGGAAGLSADGKYLSYVRASECHPDPAQPDVNVIAVPDEVVVRDLATGEERSWVFPGATADPPPSTVVSSVVWYGDSLLVLVDGRLVRLDLGEPAVPPVADGTAVQPTTGDARDVTLLGARADGTVVSLSQLDPAEASGAAMRVVAIDPTTGYEVTEIAVLDQPGSLNVDRSGRRWAAIVSGSVIVDGTQTVLEVPPQPPGLDSFEDRPTTVGW